MPQYFIKKGRKETIENSFKAFLFNRAPLKKKRLRTIIFKSMAHITPFVRLKVRKRRRYTKYKLHPAKQDWGRRKALGSFIKVFKGHKSKDFFITLEKELGILQSGKSNIQVKRDEYHKIAWRWAPYKWKKAIYLAQKQAKAKAREKKEAAEEASAIARKLKRDIIQKDQEWLKLHAEYEAREVKRESQKGSIREREKEEREKEKKEKGKKRNEFLGYRQRRNTAMKKSAKAEAKKVDPENVSKKKK